MRCLRCQGLMITIWMKDLLSAGAATGWRCLLCGEALAPGIEADRMGYCQPVKSWARVPGSPPASHGKRRP
jgi:hypothetical protein